MSVAERFTGRVKWFNNKAGYGFITVTDGSKAGSDIFVHHSSIKIDTEQYKYLVQGEYVEFCLSSVSTGDHEFQAGEVSGIKGGKLMCETRNELRTYRTQHQEQVADSTWTQTRKPRSVAAPVPASVPTTEAKPLRRTASQGPVSTSGSTGAGRGAGRGSTGRGGRGAGGRAGGRGSPRT